MRAPSVSTGCQFSFFFVPFNVKVMLKSIDDVTDVAES